MEESLRIAQEEIEENPLKTAKIDGVLSVFNEDSVLTNREPVEIDLTKGTISWGDENLSSALGRGIGI